MIVVADLHLGKVSDSIMIDGYHSQTLDVLARLEEVEEAAIEGETIVIAGDIFNKVNPRSEIIGVFFTWLGSVSKKHRVHLLPGNHDCGLDWASIGMVEGLKLDNVVITVRATVCTISEGGVDRDIIFVPHIPLKQVEEIVGAYGDLGSFITDRFTGEVMPELVIGHGMVKGVDYKNDIFYEAGNALEIDIRTFPKFKLMVLGHVHQHTVLRPTKYKTVVYPGSMTITNFGEVEDEKGYVRVDLGTLAWKFIPFTSEVTPYRDILIDLVSKDTVNLSDEILKDASKGAVVKIRVLARDLIQVEETKLRKAFNKYGWVSRFEVELHKKDRSVDVDGNGSGLLFNISHDNLVRKYISGCEESDSVKQLAISQAKEIIREVLDAE